MAIKIAGLYLIACVLCGCDAAPRKAEQAYQAGLEAKKRGDFRQAIEQFRNVLELDPLYGKAYAEIGELLCRDRKYADALKQLLRALEYDAASYRVYAYTGYAHERLGRLGLAERAYRQAIRYAPESPEVWLRLGDMLETQDRRREAAEMLSDALAHYPDMENQAEISARIALLRQAQHPDIHRALADLYVFYGNVEKGIAEYQRAESLDPRNPETFAKFGLFCLERGQLKTAEAYLRRAIDLGVTDQPDVRASLGFIYEQAGEIREAIEEYRAVLQLRPNQTDIRLQLADLLERLHQNAGAADVLTPLLKYRQGTDINALWSRILRLRGQDSEKAVVQLKRMKQYLLVPAVVNGKAPATVMLDPRSAYTIISEPLAQRLNILLSTKTSDVQFEFYGRTFKAPLINLPAMQVGALTVRNIPTLIGDLSAIPGIDGVLGMSFLKYFQVEINPTEQLVVLTQQHASMTYE